MIEFVQGNLFDAEVDASVNAVNCVGVMGKGIALEFKKRFPDNFMATKPIAMRADSSLDGY
jgi:O-acetyl-ADP-ribose deacetylase (regulator of RNase III)